MENKMKNCPRCNAPNEDNAVICTSCGVPFNEAQPQQQYTNINPQQPPQYQSSAPQYQMPGGQYQTPNNMPPYTPQKKKKKGCLTAILIAIAIFIILIIMGAIFGDSSDSSSNSSSTNNAQDSATVTAQTNPENENNVGNYKVELVDSYITEDSNGDDILVVTYSFTNNDDEPRAFVYTIDDKAYQNGVELGDVYSSYGIDGYDFTTSNSEIKPGVTVEVQEAYELYDTSTSVEIDLSIIFSDDVEQSYTIELK